METLLSLISELGLVVFLRQFLLPYKLSVLRWVPLLKEGREPHRVITRLNPLCPTIQSPITGEEISEGAFYWIERYTSHLTCSHASVRPYRKDKQESIPFHP